MSEISQTIKIKLTNRLWRSPSKICNHYSWFKMIIMRLKTTFWRFIILVMNISRSLHRLKTLKIQPKINNFSKKVRKAFLKVITLDMITKRSNHQQVNITILCRNLILKNTLIEWLWLKSFLSNKTTKTS